MQGRPVSIQADVVYSMPDRQSHGPPSLVWHRIVVGRPSGPPMAASLLTARGHRMSGPSPCVPPPDDSNQVSGSPGLASQTGSVPADEAGGPARVRATRAGGGRAR